MNDFFPQLFFYGTILKHTLRSSSLFGFSFLDWLPSQWYPQRTCEACISFHLAMHHSQSFFICPPQKSLSTCPNNLKLHFSTNSCICFWSLHMCCLDKLRQFYQWRFLSRWLSRIQLSLPSPTETRLMG